MRMTLYTPKGIYALSKLNMSLPFKVPKLSDPSEVNFSSFARKSKSSTHVDVERSSCARAIRAKPMSRNVFRERSRLFRLERCTEVRHINLEKTYF